LFEERGEDLEQEFGVFVSVILVKKEVENREKCVCGETPITRSSNGMSVECERKEEKRPTSEVEQL
jgi:hypothetical protein